MHQDPGSQLICFHFWLFQWEARFLCILLANVSSSFMSSFFPFCTRFSNSCSRTCLGVHHSCALLQQGSIATVQEFQSSRVSKWLVNSRIAVRMSSFEACSLSLCVCCFFSSGLTAGVKGSDETKLSKYSSLFCSSTGCSGVFGSSFCPDDQPWGLGWLISLLRALGGRACIHGVQQGTAWRVNVGPMAFLVAEHHSYIQLFKVLYRVKTEIPRHQKH